MSWHLSLQSDHVTDPKPTIWFQEAAKTRGFLSPLKSSHLQLDISIFSVRIMKEEDIIGMEYALMSKSLSVEKLLAFSPSTAARL